MFYGTVILSLIQCWRLSSSWKAISEYWVVVERMLCIKYVPSDPTLRKRLIVVIVLITVCASCKYVKFNTVLSDLDWIDSTKLITQTWQDDRSYKTIWNDIIGRKKTKMLLIRYRKSRYAVFKFLLPIFLPLWSWSQFFRDYVPCNLIEMSAKRN